MLNTVTLLIFVTAYSASAFGQTSGAAKLEVRQKQPYGRYITDSSGRAVYMFEKDSKGTSNCYDACAQAWPPLITTGKPDAGSSVNASLIGTIQRKDGRTQVTYGGMPLYYYVKDQGSGSTTGQDVHDQWGGWYLVSPKGEKIEAEKKS